MSKAQLGEAVGIALAAANAVLDDPISRETGYYGDPFKAARRALEPTGWSIEDLIDAVEDRCGAKWVYQSGLGILGDG